MHTCTSKEKIFLRRGTCARLPACDCLFVHEHLLDLSASVPSSPEKSEPSSFGPWQYAARLFGSLQIVFSVAIILNQYPRSTVNAVSVPRCNLLEISPSTAVHVSSWSPSTRLQNRGEDGTRKRGNAPSDLDGSMSDTFPDHTLQLGVSILLSQIADCSNHQS